MKNLRKINVFQYFQAWASLAKPGWLKSYIYIIHNIYIEREREREMASMTQRKHFILSIAQNAMT